MQSCYPLDAFAFIAAALTPSRHPVLSQVDILIWADFQRPACHAGIEASRIKKFVTFPFLSFHQSPLELPMIHVHRGRFRGDDPAVPQPECLRQGGARLHKQSVEDSLKRCNVLVSMT